MSIFKKEKENKNNMLERRSSFERPSIDRFYKRMNDLFEDFFGEWDINLPTTESLQSSGFMPQIDVKEDDKKVYVEAELPGLNEKEINVELKDNVLTISGEKKEEKEEKDKKYHRVERSYGYFQRSINLGSKVDEKNVKASFKNGVLAIELPKDVEKITKSVKIDIK